MWNYSYVAGRYLFVWFEIHSSATTDELKVKAHSVDYWRHHITDTVIFVRLSYSFVKWQHCCVFKILKNVIKSPKIFPNEWWMRWRVLFCLLWLWQWWILLGDGEFHCLIIYYTQRVSKSSLVSINEEQILLFFIICTTIPSNRFITSLIFHFLSTYL